MRKQPLHVLSVAGGYEVKKCIAAGGIEVIPANVLPVRSLQTCFGGDGVYPPVNIIDNKSGFSSKENLSGKALRYNFRITPVRKFRQGGRYQPGVKALAGGDVSGAKLRLG